MLRAPGWSECIIRFSHQPGTAEEEEDAMPGVGAGGSVLGVADVKEAVRGAGVGDEFVGDPSGSEGCVKRGYVLLLYAVISAGEEAKDRSGKFDGLLERAGSTGLGGTSRHIPPSGGGVAPKWLDRK
jgi:hypothetical protein